MSRRDDILARVRAATGDPRPAPLPSASPAPRPDLGGTSPDDLVTRFMARAEASDATVERVPDLHAVPQAAARYLARHGLAPEIALAPDDLLRTVPFRLQAPVTVRVIETLSDWRRAEARPDWVSSGAIAVLSRAAFAVAETGTLVMLSGRGTPASLNVLPETFVALVAGPTIVPHYEDVWAALSRDGRAVLPRAVQFVTGPSRSADIEQTIQLGAHGPRRVHIVIVDRVGATADRR